MIVLELLRSRAGRLLVLVGVLVMLLAVNAEAFQAAYQERLAELTHHGKPPKRGQRPTHPPARALPAPPPPSQVGRADIPPTYLALYQQAATICPGLPWRVLAGIGKVETNHGRGWPPDWTARAGIARGTENSAGAGGPMQFLAGTWAIYGRGGDRWDPRDAIPAAARLLCANGAPGDVRGAVYAYNHAGWYVDQVLTLARSYTRS